MKKPLLIFLCIGLCFCANGHNEKSRKSVQSDNLLESVLHAIKDTTQSYLDIKPELFSLIDSMQLYVEFCPKGKVRFAAKSIAMTLSQLMLDTTLNSPEELNFFMDSVLPKLDNVLQTWYVEASAPNEELQWKTMVQYAIRLENSHNYVTEGMYISCLILNALHCIFHMMLLPIRVLCSGTIVGNWIPSVSI